MAAAELGCVEGWQQSSVRAPAKAGLGRYGGAGPPAEGGAFRVSAHTHHMQKGHCHVLCAPRSRGARLLQGRMRPAAVGMDATSLPAAPGCRLHQSPQSFVKSQWVQIAGFHMHGSICYCQGDLHC